MPGDDVRLGRLQRPGAASGGPPEFQEVHGSVGRGVRIVLELLQDTLGGRGLPVEAVEEGLLQGQHAADRIAPSLQASSPVKAYIRQSAQLHQICPAPH